MLSAQSQTNNGADMESDDEEPAPEALMRYMAMRRHTIGVGDGHTPADTRPPHKPLMGKHS